MFARVLTTTALGVGGLLGLIAMVAVPGAALSGLVFGAVFGVLGLRWVRGAAAGDAASKARAGRRAGLIIGAGVTGGWLALAGLVLLLGPASGPALLLLAVIGSAWWWRRSEPGSALRVNPWHAARDRLLRAAQRPDPPQPDGSAARVGPRSVPVAPPAPMPIPADLTTPQLCLAWQRTYFALLDLSGNVPHGEVVALRALLLDEIERRDPDGFTRWLDADARAGGNPGRYLSGGR